MNNGVINDLLNNKILSLSLSETDQNIFRTYLSALKLNKSLIVLYLQNIGYYNVQAFLNILTHNKSLQQIYFSNCNNIILSTILYYFKINYFINIHLSLYASFNLSDIENLSELMLYDSNNIIELFCVINDENCMIINNKLNILDMEILDNNFDFLSNYKLNVLLFYIKPLIKTLLTNKLLYLHLNFLMLFFNKDLIPLLKNKRKDKYDLPNNVMKRIDITNDLKFYDPITMIRK